MSERTERRPRKSSTIFFFFLSAQGNHFVGGGWQYSFVSGRLLLEGEKVSRTTDKLTFKDNKQSSTALKREPEATECY